MKKWHVEIETTIQAETREQVWRIARELCEEKFRGLAQPRAVSLKPEPHPEWWIAVNEPIKAKR